MMHRTYRDLLVLLNGRFGDAPEITDGTPTFDVICSITASENYPAPQRKQSRACERFLVSDGVGSE